MSRRLFDTLIERLAHGPVCWRMVVTVAEPGDPTVLPTGIALSDDPLLAARSSVYARSYQRCIREPHTPSAVDVSEVRRAQ
ncbi:hypothetical protein [Nocardia sp. NBC_00511]|uniref:hypothetical protein n=1 Tax=Nocardia sp. NBC_00511 TaxID=2903591 RepID=UPI002F908287